MTSEQKQLFLDCARDHVRSIIEKVEYARKETADSINRLLQEARFLSRDDQISSEGVALHLQERVNELDNLRGSPYFVRCDIVTSSATKRTYYFSKFQMGDESIYSWIAPAAVIRFEKPGQVSYTALKGKIQSCLLERKDSCMIIEGNITFLATESEGSSRELIYQKDFTSRKVGFILPEIVEQMEKAQDQIIRANHRGAFVVTGPAGSGKTTLALHRLAFLTLSPDTASLFTSSKMVVFVQDGSSKDYFSHLLPELGIRDVNITTFSEWACEILDLSIESFIQTYGACEEESNRYEYEKIKALKRDIPAYAHTPYIILDSVYLSLFSDYSRKIYQRQKKEHVFDRIDLTILLRSFQYAMGALSKKQEYFIQQKNHALKKKIGRLPVHYSLIVVDEFQNYLTEQLQLLKTCLIAPQQGLLYVGDISQQVHFGTINNLSEIEGIIPEERNVKLQKIYRNTKNILRYIKDLGYDVAIPEHMSEGLPVKEMICKNQEEEIACIKKQCVSNSNRSIGILCHDDAYLEPFRKAFSDKNTVYVKTMRQSQGVEFERVYLVGLHETMFDIAGYSDMPHEFHGELIRIYKDLLYIALTRAMDELSLLGTCDLKRATRKLFQ